MFLVAAITLLHQIVKTWRFFYEIKKSASKLIKLIQSWIYNILLSVYHTDPS